MKFYCILFVALLGLTSVVHAQGMTDTDGDGMPDAWEISMGLNPNDASDALADKDGDGVPNLWEYLRGTNANNASDFPPADVIVTPTPVSVPGGPPQVSTLMGAFGMIPEPGPTDDPDHHWIIRVKPGTYSSYLWAIDRPEDDSGIWWTAKNIAWIAERKTDGTEGVVLQPLEWAQTIALGGTSVFDGFIMDGLNFRPMYPTNMGALSISGPRVRVVNTIMRNWTYGEIVNWGPNFSLVNCSLFHSPAFTGSGGISITNYSATATFALLNNIVWDSKAGATPPQQLIGVAGKFVGTTNILQNPTANGGAALPLVTSTSTANPNLSTTGHLTLLSSAAIGHAADQASGTVLSRMAIDGHLRPLTGSDIGADEIGVVDTDGDGMPDIWEISMGLNPNDASDALADKDGDGVPNLWEYLRGTNANNASDFPPADVIVTPTPVSVPGGPPQVSTLMGAFGMIPEPGPTDDPDHHWIIRVKPGTYSSYLWAIDRPEDDSGIWWTAKNIAWIAERKTDGTEGVVLQPSSGAETTALGGTSVFDGFIMDGLNFRPMYPTNMGALFISGPRVRVVNTIMRNWTYGEIVNWGPNFSLVNCTLFHSPAFTGPGSISITNDYATSTFTLLNNIVWDSKAGGTPPQQLFGVAGKFVGTTNILQNPTANGGAALPLVTSTSTANPNLSATGHLNFLSTAAIGHAADQASGTVLSPMAIDGHLRPLTGSDIGADEIGVVDTDGDGMLDIWEASVGLNSNDASDALADKDGDGVPNLWEYLRGTDYTNAASTPGPDAIVTMTPTAGATPPEFSTLQDAYASLPSTPVDRRWIVKVKRGSYEMVLKAQSVTGITPKKVTWMAERGPSGQFGYEGTLLKRASTTTDNLQIETDAVFDGFIMDGRGASSTPPITLYSPASSHCQLRLVNVIMRDWAGSIDGGGGDLWLVNSTIMHSNAFPSTGWQVLSTTSGQVHFINSIVWDAQYTSGPQFQFGTGLVSGSGNIIQHLPSGTAVTGTVTTDPHLTDGGYLTASSTAAIAHGGTAAASPNDINGDVRPATNADIGADQWVDTNANGLPNWWESWWFQAGFSTTASADPDGDGTGNGVEYQQHSAPVAPGAFTADTDGDGMDDAWERQNGLDPSALSDGMKDLDGDRVPNLWEFRRGFDPATPSAVFDAVVDGSQATNATLHRYATLQEAYNYVPAFLPGTATVPYYSVILVKPGTYTGALTGATTPKKVCWIADNTNGLVILKPTGTATAALLTDTTVMDGFIIGDSANTTVTTGMAVSIVPDASLYGVPPKIKLANCVITGRKMATAQKAAVCNQGGDLTLVHCTLVGNIGTSPAPAHAIANITGTVSLVNTIVGVQVTGSSIPPVYNASGTTFSSDFSIITGSTLVSSTWNQNPGLVNAWHLAANSASLALAGSQTAGVLTDIYGSPRGATPHLGAEQWIASLIPAPQNLLVQARLLTSLTATLEWDPQTSQKQQGYRVEKSTNGSTFTLAGSVGPSVTTFAVTGLLANSTYYYRVVATHPQQDSLPSNVVIITTYANPVAPKTPAVSNITANGMTVTWTAGGTNQTNYVVEVSLDGSSWTPFATVPTGTLTATLTGLQEKTTYSVRVGAVNPTATVYSVVLTGKRTLPDVPLAPSNLSIATPTNSNVALTWTDNATDETTFLVEQSTDGTTWTTSTTSPTPLSPNASGCQVTLLGNSAYQFRLKAVNTDGSNTKTSTASNTVSVPVFPLTPTAGSMTAVSSRWNQVDVAWGLPVDSTRSGVQLKVTKVGSPDRIILLGPDVLTYSDLGLDPSTQYQYTVYTVNLRGLSVVGRSATVVTQTNLPNVPTSVWVTAVGHQSSIIGWTDYPATGASPDVYETSLSVERWDAVGGTWAPLVTLLTPGTTTFKDETTVAGTSYSYRVRAVNQYGSSSPSAVVSVTMPSNNKPDALAVDALQTAAFSYPSLASSMTDYSGYARAQARMDQLSATLWVQGYHPVSSNDVAFAVIDSTAPATPVAVLTSASLYSDASVEDTWALSNQSAGRVLVSGNHIFISTPHAPSVPFGSGNACGAVYVFEWNPATSTVGPALRLVPQDGANGDGFGTSLAVDGDRVLIGSPNADVVKNGTTYANAGRVYFYEFSGGTWVPGRAEVSPALEQNLQFGFSVALRGRHVVIGAPYQDVLAPTQKTNAGSIYFGMWDQPAVLDRYDGPQSMAGALFGWSLALDPTLQLCIGAPVGTNSLDSTKFGNVFLLYWNGGLGEARSAVYSPVNIVLGPDDINATIGRSVKWNVFDRAFYLLSDYNNLGSTAHTGYRLVNAVNASVGVAVGLMQGYDPDGDPLTYSLTTGQATTATLPGTLAIGLATPADFDLLYDSGGKPYLKPKASLTVGRAYSIGVTVADNHGASRVFNLQFLINNEPAIDPAYYAWLNSFGLPFSVSDVSIAGDGLTTRAKYLRHNAGMTTGIDPTKWDLDPYADDDGDGVINGEDVEPFDPLIGRLQVFITSPVSDGQ